jgi:hypothetical protein
LAEQATIARERWIAIGVFAVALLVRVLFLFATPDRAWPHSVLYEGDAPTWVRWAQALDRGQPFEFDLPMRTPGVAYALHGAIAGVASPPFTIAKLVWCAISAATCAALFVVTRRMFSARIAVIAAAWLCFSFGAYELATSLNNEAPYCLLVVLLVGATSKFVETPGWKLAIGLGVLHGLALLLRAEHALLLVAFAAFAAWKLRPARKSWLAAVTAASAVLVCVPWIVRSHRAVERFNTVAAEQPDFQNARPPWTADARAFLLGLPAFARAGSFAFLQHLASTAGKPEISRADVEQFFRGQFGYVPEPLSTWTLSSSKGALDFALANHPSSGGGFSLAALQDGHDPDPQFSLARPSHLALYNHGYRLGWDEIRADFGAWIGLVAEKLGRFNEGVTLGLGALDEPHGVASVRHPVDLATPASTALWWSIAVEVLVLTGVALAWRRGALWAIVIAYKLAVTVLFYGYARQAVSIAPAFMVFGAVAVDAVLERWLRGRWTTLTGAAFAAVLIAIDVFHCTHAPALDIRPLSADAKMLPAGEWGPGAFESPSEIAIEPKR